MSRKRKCCNCKEYYPTDEGMILPAGFFHNWNCVSEYGKKNGAKARAKAKDKEHRERKRKLKDDDRSFELKKTQQIFNAYIRLRDNDLPCISCNRNHVGQYHAGHYRTVGANPELRFDERNCHKQCAPCNNHLSGNLVNYRINLLSKFGVEFVDFLEGSHPPKRYTIDNLKTIQKWYKRKIRRIEDAKN